MSKAKSSGTSGPAPRADKWRVIGPGGGGGQFLPTISPHDPNIVVERCDMTGAYVTLDGGESWRMYNLRTVVQAFEFDPGQAGVIYAANIALWRSEDTGRTWSMVFPDPARPLRELMVGDHADNRLVSEDPSFPGGGRRFQAIAVDPADSERVFVVLSGGGVSLDPTGAAVPKAVSLYCTSDRGATWGLAAELSHSKVWALHVGPGPSAEERAVYVVGDGGVDRGRGGEWEHFEGPPGGETADAAIGRAGSGGGGEPFIYATTACSWEGDKLVGGVHVSTDGGRTWRACEKGLTDSLHAPGEGAPPAFRAVACQAKDGRTAYAGFGGAPLDRASETRFAGVAKTTDGGETWELVIKDSNVSSPNVEGSYLEIRALDSWPNIYFAPPISLGVAPSDGDVCYITDAFRTLRTTDGGGTWSQVHSAEVGDDQWSTRGLDVTTCYGVHFDPFDAKHMFITYTDIGLFGSRDAGESWTGATVGIPNKWRNTTYWLVFDPEVKDLMWGAFGFNHDLPRPKMWRAQDPANYKGGVADSTDGGRHWEVSNDGLPESSCTDILLDPGSSPGERVLYVCAYGRGVYKSIDGGRTWQLRNEGIEGPQPFAWRVTRASDGTLYLVVARRSDDGRIGDDEDGALYRSTDGAGHWERMALPEGVNGPNGLAVNPADDGRLYLAVWGRHNEEGDTHGGVYVSADGGATWKNTLDESPHIYDVTVDPGRPGVVYCCGFDSSAFRSVDSGETWRRIPGYNFKWGHRVNLDPVDASKIYITTFGGSVWHGPAEGDPEAVEDIVAPKFPL